MWQVELGEPKNAEKGSYLGLSSEALNVITQVLLRGSRSR